MDDVEDQVIFVNETILSSFNKIYLYLVSNCCHDHDEDEL